MASWADLAQRLERLQAADSKLHVHAAYRSAPIPAWIATPCDEAARHAGAAVPVVVINCKHHTVDGALVVMSLADLERILAG